MKRVAFGCLVLAAVSTVLGEAHAQNVEGQIIAAQYGAWRVRGQTPNTYSFVLNDCQQIAGKQPFHPFAKNAPITIVDADPSQTETATPVGVIDNAQTCAITLVTQNPHNSFSLQSATGGLQEALNSAVANPAQNNVLLTPQWYLNGGNTGMLATVKGANNVGIIDVTTTPYTGYTWNGTAYQVVPTGGGASAAPPAYAIQFGNISANALQGSSAFTIDPTKLRMQSAGNFVVTGSAENVPRRAYDPMNTAYAGGWAAAVAGTSGHTLNDVLTATINAAECDYLTGATSIFGDIEVPTNVGTVPLVSVALWPYQGFGGVAWNNHPTFQHSTTASAMITIHQTGDQITCANGTTYTPALGSHTRIHDLWMSGGGSGNPQSTTQDIGILIPFGSGGNVIERVGGVGNAFGGPAILNEGLETKVIHAGTSTANLAGCAAYTSGNVPVAGASPNQCGGYSDFGTDGYNEDVYATDGVFGSSGGKGACYPGCAAMINQDPGSRNANLFLQVSDIGLISNATGATYSNVRVDRSAREALVFNTFAGGVVTGTMVTSACTDNALATAYAAGTATGCGVLNNSAQMMSFDGFSYGSAPNEFGNSYVQAWIIDNLNGASASPNRYSGVTYIGNPANTTHNDLEFSGAFAGDAASGHVDFPTTAQKPCSTASCNVSGITSLGLTTTTPLTTMSNAIAGQVVTITALQVSGATVATGGNFTLCAGNTTEPVTSSPRLFLNYGGLQFGNNWQEVCGGFNGTAAQGLTLNTTSTQPSCTSAYRGKLWTVQGDGTTTPDQLQQCQLTAAGSYVWHSF